MFRPVLLLTLAHAASAKPRPATLLRHGRKVAVPGGLDFGAASLDEQLGKLCLVREEEVAGVERVPRRQCELVTRQQCTVSQVTRYRPSQQEVCTERFVKTCFIDFTLRAVNTTTRDCFKPLVKHCPQHQPGTSLHNNSFVRPRPVSRIRGCLRGLCVGGGVCDGAPHGLLHPAAPRHQPRSRYSGH